MYKKAVLIYDSKMCPFENIWLYVIFFTNRFHIHKKILVYLLMITRTVAGLIWNLTKHFNYGGV